MISIKFEDHIVYVNNTIYEPLSDMIEHLSVKKYYVCNWLYRMNVVFNQESYFYLLPQNNNPLIRMYLLSIKESTMKMQYPMGFVSAAGVPVPGKTLAMAYIVKQEIGTIC